MNVRLWLLIAALVSGSAARAQEGEVAEVTTGWRYAAELGAGLVGGAALGLLGWYTLCPPTSNAILGLGYCYNLGSAWIPSLLGIGIGTGLGVGWVGDTLSGRSHFWMALVGSAIGAAVGLLELIIMVNSALLPLAVIAPITPVIVSMIVYEMTAPAIGPAKEEHPPPAVQVLVGPGGLAVRMPIW